MLIGSVSGEELTKRCSAGGGGSGEGLKKWDCTGKTACWSGLEASAAAWTWPEEGARVRKERRMLAVTLPAEVHVLPGPDVRLRIIVGGIVSK